MPITGNTSFNNIENKTYINVQAETDKQNQIIDELNKQNIHFSALYSDKNITVTVDRNDMHKAKNAIDSIVNNALDEKTQQTPTKQTPVQEKAETQQEPSQTDRMQENIQNELRKLMLKLSSDPELMKSFFAAQNSQDTVQQTKTQAMPEKEPTTTLVQENKSVLAELDTSKENNQLLPIINSRVENQQKKLDNLSMKREFAESKISMQQERINNLSAKAERLETTNQMLKELINNKVTPAFVKSAAQKAIDVNSAKIAKIRSNKIPKREAKIEKQQDKVAKFDRQINLAHCKIDRYTSLNNVITSFSLSGNSERRKQFAEAMDNLHSSSVNLCNARIDISTAKISDLTEKYNNSKDTAFKSATHQAIIRQKINRQKNINKRNKLMGVVIPMTAQPEKVQEEALKRTEETVNNELKKDNITVSELADNVAAAPLPALPEKSFEEPDPLLDSTMLLAEIAPIMGVSVSELESKPLDIQTMLIDNYINSFESTPEEIKESLSKIITPDPRTEEQIEENQQKKKLVSLTYEAYNDHDQMWDDQVTFYSTMDGKFIAEHRSGYDGSTVVKDLTADQVKQSIITIVEKYDDVRSDDTQLMNNIRNNPIKAAEELVEGNYDMIDGIINNTPVQQENDIPAEEAPATISMSDLIGNVAIAEEIYDEQKKDDPQKDKNPLSIDD